MKNAWLWIACLIIALFSFAACSSDDSTTDGDAADGDADRLVDGDDETANEEPDGDTLSEEEAEEESAPAAALVGSPCLEAGDCATGYCLNDETASTILQPDMGAEEEAESLPEGTIPGGYCSLIFCSINGGDACTTANGGVCLGLKPLIAGLNETDGICLKPCVQGADCRLDQEESCFDPQTLVEMDKLSQADKDHYFGDTSACLPNAIFNAVLNSGPSTDGDGNE